MTHSQNPAARRNLNVHLLLLPFSVARSQLGLVPVQLLGGVVLCKVSEGRMVLVGIELGLALCSEELLDVELVDGVRDAVESATGDVVAALEGLNGEHGG